jgi:phosphohistidine phosphatase
MSRVMLLRHSKAAKAGPGMRDFDRPLEERGIQHAVAVGEAMAAAYLKPDLVLCSPARRTRETWDGVRSALGEVEVRFPDELYHSGADGYLAAIRTAGQVESVLVIGHNPMTAETASMLVGSGDPKEIAGLRARFPTSSLAVIGFDTPLAQVAPGAGTLEAWMMRD